MQQLKTFLFRRNDRVRRIKPNSRIVANYFQNRQWQLVTFLEQMSGSWPHQSKLKQYPLQLFHFFISITAMLAVANKLCEYVGIDTNMTIECCLLILIYLGLIVKLMFASACQQSRRKVYKRIVKHFETINDAEEVAVLNKGTEGGFKYTLVYMCITIVVLAIFDGAPILRSFTDYFFNHCELRVQMPVPINYGFDHKKYWYIIAIDFILWSYSALFIESAYNLSYMLQVRHVAALFKIVGIRLRKISELAEEFGNTTVSNLGAKESYSLMSSAVDLHSECFELVKLIEKSYSLNWLIIILISTGGFGAGLHLVSTKLHDPIETLRYASAFMIIVLHFQMVFSEGQLIIDSAESVSKACCKCKWYGLPKQTSKLLFMMMIRASIPCQITGAKLFPLSMESFGKMLKAGLSYYTVFRAK